MCIRDRDTGNYFGREDTRIMVGPSLMQINIHMTGEKQMARGKDGKIDPNTGLPKKGSGIGAGGMAASEQFMFATTTSNAKEFVTIANSDAYYTMMCTKCGNVDLNAEEVIKPETDETIKPDKNKKEVPIYTYSCPVCIVSVIKRAKYSQSRRNIDVMYAPLGYKERVIIDPSVNVFGITNEEQEKILNDIEEDYTIDGDTVFESSEEENLSPRKPSKAPKTVISKRRGGAKKVTTVSTKGRMSFQNKKSSKK